MTTPETLIADFQAAGRVCPQPLRWKELWEMLPDRRRAGAGWEPPLPLILAAWHHTSDEEKRQRLLLHLRWAADHGAMDTIAAFLASLSPADWHTSSTDH